jgi:large subunit ribosomal protein L31e
MVDTREYVIPLRKEWQKVAKYKRTRRAVNEIKAFIARHMKVADRDVEKVKLDVYLNNELWFRGCKKPPAKIKVKAKREGENVLVELIDMPNKWKFLKARQEKIHKKVEEKKIKEQEKKEEKTDEEKKVEEEKKEEEKEKAKSSAIAQEKAMEKMAKTQKHTIQTDKAPQIQRKALKK